jgi:pyrroloquinoline quinone (PQQ) biosynthesis protein C
MNSMEYAHVPVPERRFSHMKLITYPFRAILVTATVVGLLAIAPLAASDSGIQHGLSKSASEQQARKLVAELRQELAPVENQIRNHRFLYALERGEVPNEALVGFAVEEFYIIQSDLRSQAVLTSRFGVTPSGDFFRGLLGGERIAFDLIRRFGTALGLEEDELAAREPRPGGQAFPNAVASLATFRTEAEAAAAFLLNFGVFGENTARMAVALQNVYGFTPQEVEFFTFFGTPIPGFEEAALAVIAVGLEKGAQPRDIKRAARLLQEYELQFWDTVAEAP